MSQAAAHETCGKRMAAPMPAPGSTFFGMMVATWSAFVTLLAVAPATLDDAYDWLRGLPVVWEILMWIVTLPWAVGYLVYKASWEHWLRVLVVALIVIVHLSASVPRVKR